MNVQKVRMIQTQGPHAGHVINCDATNTAFWEAEGFRLEALAYYAAARDDGWAPGDEDTAEQYCDAFAIRVDHVSTAQCDFWRDEFMPARAPLSTETIQAAIRFQVETAEASARMALELERQGSAVDGSADE